jgi:hypothetical protein
MSSVDCDLQKAVAVANKPYKWYGFNVLTSECSNNSGDSDLVHVLKKFPNVFLYTTIGLSLILLLVLITRVRAG